MRSSSKSGNGTFDKQGRYDPNRARELAKDRESQYQKYLPEPSHSSRVIAEIVSLDPPATIGRERWDNFVDELLEHDARNDIETIVSIIEGEWLGSIQELNEETILQHLDNTPHLSIKDPACLLAAARAFSLIQNSA
jgi:hypothetical protein